MKSTGTHAILANKPYW